MNYILSLFQNRKLVIGFVVVSIIGFSVAFGWNKIKKGIYDKGYNDAVIEYQLKIAEQKEQYDEYVIYKLSELRKELNYQHKQDLIKLEKESKVDEQVRTVTEYIRENVYVQDNCDVVPTELNSLFNDSIRSINGSKQD